MAEESNLTEAYWSCVDCGFEQSERFKKCPVCAASPAGLFHCPGTPNHITYTNYSRHAASCSTCQGVSAGRQSTAAAIETKKRLNALEELGEGTFQTALYPLVFDR